MATTSRGIEIIGIPMDLGASMRGANIGPAAIRIAGLRERLQSLGISVVDAGDIPVPVRETIASEDVRAHFRSAIVDVAARTWPVVKNALDCGRLPLVLGGDHSAAIGTIAGVSSHFRAKGQDVGLVWIDAHADLNTPETSPSGNIHGMPLAIALGLGHHDLVGIGGFAPKIKPDKTALVGIRDLDPAEKKFLKDMNIPYFTMRQIDERGMAAVMSDAITLAGGRVGPVHVSFDLDGIDPIYAPGTGTPVRGGLSYREAHLALEMLADTGSVCSVEFLELNPMCDRDNQTGVLAVELAMSIFGKSIV